MKKLLAMLLALSIILSAAAVGFAEMELDVEENELGDFGDNEEFDFGADAEAPEDDAEEPEDDAEEPEDDVSFDDLTEEDLNAVEGDGSSFEYDFGGEGYTGTWVEIPKYNMQFCLPEGWKQTTINKTIYAAENAKGTVSMGIYLKANNVDDIEAWAEKNLKPGTQRELKSVGFYSALVVRGKNNRLSIFIATDSGKVLQFVFKRAKANSLEESAALNIVSSLYEDWFDDADLIEEMEAEAVQ